MSYEITEKIVVEEEGVVVSSAPSDLRPLVFVRRVDEALTRIHREEGLHAMLTVVARSMHRGERRLRANSAITRGLRAGLNIMTLDVFLTTDEDEAAERLATLAEEKLLGKRAIGADIVKVRLFGALEMENGWGHYVEKRSRQPHPQMLLKYLLVNPGREVGLPELRKTVWRPDGGENLTENSARVRLRRLRASLAPMRLDSSRTGLITYYNGYYGLRSRYTIQIDAEEFADLAWQIGACPTDDPVGLQLCREALVLYRGPYMEFTKDAPWLDSLRNHYKREFVYVAKQTLRRSKELGTFDVIPLLSRRSAAVAPENEKLQREIIGCLREHRMELERVRHVSQLTASGQAGWLEFCYV